MSFDSTMDALAAQKKTAQYKPTMIPTPRSITAACGMSLRLSFDSKESAREALMEAAVEEDTYVLYRFADGEYRIVT